MTLRIAAVSFLNTVPLIEMLVAEPGGGATLTRALPSAISQKLLSGQADIGLLPVFEIFLGRSAGILSRACIGGTGAVDSVKLFTRGGLGTVDRLLVDRGSRTSVALTRVLLAEMEGRTPPLEHARPVPGSRPEEGQGVLVIGDLCFAYEKALSDDPEVQAHDLGALWYDLTGLPFVFATWAAAPGWPDRAGPEAVTRAAELLERARDHGLARLGDLAVREAANGAMGPGGDATSAAIDYYFRTSLDYTLGEDHLAGLRKFHALCLSHDLIPATHPPSLL